MCALVKFHGSLKRQLILPGTSKCSNIQFTCLAYGHQTFQSVLCLSMLTARHIQYVYCIGTSTKKRLHFINLKSITCTLYPMNTVLHHSEINPGREPTDMAEILLQILLRVTFEEAIQCNFQNSFQS